MSSRPFPLPHSHLLLITDAFISLGRRPLLSKSGRLPSPSCAYKPAIVLLESFRIHSTRFPLDFRLDLPSAPVSSSSPVSSSAAQILRRRAFFDQAVSLTVCAGARGSRFADRRPLSATGNRPPQCPSSADRTSPSAAILRASPPAQTPR